MQLHWVSASVCVCVCIYSYALDCDIWRLYCFWRIVLSLSLSLPISRMFLLALDATGVLLIFPYSLPHGLASNYSIYEFYLSFVSLSLLLAQYFVVISFDSPISHSQWIQACICATSYSWYEIEIWQFNHTLENTQRHLNRSVFPFHVSSYDDC